LTHRGKKTNHKPSETVGTNDSKTKGIDHGKGTMGRITKRKKKAPTIVSNR